MKLGFKSIILLTMGLCLAACKKPLPPTRAVEEEPSDVEDVEERAVAKESRKLKTDLKSSIPINGSTLKLLVPNGWLMDQELGAAQGFQAVLHRKNDAYDPAHVNINVTATAKSNRKISVRKLMLKDRKLFRQKASLMLTSEAEPTSTSAGCPISIRILSDGDGIQEATAYVDEPNWVVRIILKAPTKSDLESGLGDFEKLLGSYSFSE